MEGNLINMADKKKYDAVIVGSGPNGLAAAITMAQKGLSVLLIEAKEKIGGGMRSASLTLPGFVHDVCSSVHPLGVASPFFQSLNLKACGLKWIFPPAPLAHPLDNGKVVMLENSVNATAAELGIDRDSYRNLIQPIVNKWDYLLGEI